MTSTRASRLAALPPLRAILALALPTSAVMVLGATSGVVNTYFVARLGADAIAGVALVFPIHLILMTLMGGGIGAGVSAAVAHAHGARRLDGARDVAEHAFVLTAGLSAVLTLVFVLAAPAVFRAMGGRGAVLDDAVTYSRVLFSGIGITFVISTFDSILRGEGNVRVPSIWGTVSLSLQIVFVPLFMFPLGLGLAGAAAGMLAGQFVGSLPRAYYVFGGHGAIHPRLYPRHLAAAPLREILRIGVPASLATLANYLGLLVLTAIVARYGTSAIAAFGLATRFDFLVITLAFGIGSALLTLVGLAAGARDFRRIGRLLGSAAALVATVLLVVTVVVVWHPSLWLGLFTSDAEILRVGARYLRTVGPTYPFLGVSMACSFTFQGLGRAVFPLVLITARTLLIVALATTLATVGAPVEGVFTLIAIGNVASSVVLFARLRWLLRGL